jgi:4a-hydroxytetrahydrobiopterin dehydratase
MIPLRKIHDNKHLSPRKLTEKHTPMAQTFSRAALSQAQIDQQVEALPGWHQEAEALTKTYNFLSFVDALAFIVQVGFVSEALNHHAHIHNVYGKVTLAINTHDVKAITALDVAWAHRVEGIAHPTLAR